MGRSLTKLGLLLLSSIVICSLSFAQNQKNINYTFSEIPKENISFLGVPQIEASKFKVYEIDVATLQEQMNGVMHREHENSGFVAKINFPHPDGSVRTYLAKANSTLHPELAKKFPDIKTFDASGVDGKSRVKWDITKHGFHAMISVPGESTIFIDPLIKGDKRYYIVYRRKDLITDKRKECSFENSLDDVKDKFVPTSGELKSFGSCELRTYRLALSATGEYTIFHGGTVADAQAAQATTMNRVNGLYEQDMAITMVIIPNNDLIIYTSTAGDPFSNGNPGTMINQNQTNTDNVIGNANYDIGHVFGTNSGGLAGLGVVCSDGAKARGVTGSGAPIGDPFDIDYVAHEMGHQFGGNHTFNNSCGGNRNDATAVEPGSGVTIMAYAGICAPDIQSNSDDHFSGISLEEIGFEILSGPHTCEVITPLANSAPILLSTNGNVTVPANTPFALTAVVQDADGDPVTYNWEQMDTEISTQPPSPTSTGGPNFRSLSSSTSPTRYFPNLVDLAAGGPFTWEVIPTVSRTMNFRVTVRDNAPGAGGCNDHGDVTLTTDANSGPFIETYPTASGIIWDGNTSETVTWDVANTDVAPVACDLVDILLSTDGGQTYPIVLASDVPNDGSQLINVPSIATTTARVMVICANGTFFDISDNNFEITMATFDYLLNVSPSAIEVCQPSDAVYTVDIGEVGGYSDPVTLTVNDLPAGATANFSTNPVTPVGSSDLTISNTGSVTPGTYFLTLEASSTSGIKSATIELTIGNSNPSPVTLLNPANGSSGVAIPTDFSWTSSVEPGETYTIEIATDNGFSSVVDQSTGLTSPTYSSPGLLVNTTYYWRVMTSTLCGTSSWSNVYSFTTTGCTIHSSTDIPVAIPANGTPVVTSVIDIPTSGTINDVNVIDLIGTHSRVKNLVMTLQSPMGTVVTLMSQPCNNNHSDFDVDYDDQAASAVLPCAPIDGNAYQPVGLLADFNGEDAMGTWTLTISDMVNNNGGELTSWSLEVCTDPVVVTCVDPDIPTVDGISTICAGDQSTLSIMTGNLNDATDWQWYEGSCGGLSLGSGTSIDVIPTTTTTYFVRGEGGCVIPGNCTSIEVIVNPVYSLSETVSVCEGDSYTFPDGSSLTITSPTMYTSNLLTVNGCDSLITTNVNVNPVYSLSETVSICDGDSYTFPDGTTGTTNQLYTSNLTSANTGCDSTIVTELIVEVIDNTVTNGGGTLTANQSGAMYQWLDCDNGNSQINGANDQMFSPSQTGNYAVEVSVGNCTVISECILVDISGLEEYAENSVQIYPNPTNGELNISWNGEVTQIILTDVKGKLLQQYNTSDVKLINISLIEYANGIYFFHLAGQNGKSVHQIIKK